MQLHNRNAFGLGYRANHRHRNITGHIEAIDPNPVTFSHLGGITDKLAGKLVDTWVVHGGPFIGEPGTGVNRKMGLVACTSADIRQEGIMPSDSALSTPEDIRRLRDDLDRQGKRLVFTNGCFDLL